METLVTLAGRGLCPSLGADAFGATSEPLYQTATFDCRVQKSFDYTRSGNPTRMALEHTAAALDGATAGFAFTSGMAALSAVLRLVAPGEKVAASRDIYGGMHRQLLHCQRASGLRVEFVETWDIEAVRRALPFKMLCVESPTNPLMRVSDIRALAKLCKENNALLVVDNSIMSPVLMRPLQLGASIVVHSATKYFSGHSDVMAGLALCADEQVAKQLYFVQNAEGAGLSPNDAWLVLRGIKTMALRVAAAQRNAEVLYRTLVQHPAVVAVNYLASERVPLELVELEAAKRSFGANKDWRQEAALHFSQASGGGALMSFEMASPEAAELVVAKLKLFKNTVSFGSCSSLVETPASMSHAAVPKGSKTMSAALIRLAIGVEHVVDLERDLVQALNAAVPQPLRASASLRCPELGTPLPPGEPHAVGVAMPRWADIVAYEEGDEACLNKLRSGYPRFVFLEQIKRLFALAEKRYCADAQPPGSRKAMVAPTGRSALRLAKFLCAGSTGAGAPDVRQHDMHAFGCVAVSYPAELAGRAKKFWQHFGEIPSSRLAAQVLEDESDADHLFSEQQELVLPNLRRRIGALTGAQSGDVYLFPTGMAALSASHRISPKPRLPAGTSSHVVVFGFPYLDTLKLADIAHGQKAKFFGHANEESLRELEHHMQVSPPRAVYCEFPSNPLLRAPPLRRLRELCDRYQVPLIVDDSCAGMCNVDLLSPNGADIVCTSLTKQFCGSSNAMGGAMILNRSTALFRELKPAMDREYEPGFLYWRDAAVLLKCSEDLPERSRKSNENALQIVKALSLHPLVKEVYHPSIGKSKGLYEEYMRGQDNYGGLVSIVLHDQDKARQFFDAVNVPKGPGFGTNFSLLMPYTMLAHYTELDWAQEYGISPHLLRLWCGQEDDLTQRVLQALNSLY